MNDMAALIGALFLHVCRILSLKADGFVLIKQMFDVEEIGILTQAMEQVSPPLHILSTSLLFSSRLTTGRHVLRLLH